VDLELTGEQTLLREAVGELIARAPDADALWHDLVEFGALEEGLGAIELALIARGLGSQLAAVPFVDAAALAYVAPARGRAALCLAEPERSFTPDDPSTSLDGGRVSGEKRDVAFAGSADVLAVSVAGPSGAVLALVRPDAEGVSLEHEATLDRSLEPALVRFDAVEAQGQLDDVDLAMLAAIAGVLAAAEAVGAAAEVLDLASAYAAQRRQFGHTIGSFQAIRHLLADMYVDVESSWSSVLYAAASLDEREPDALRTAAIAKAYAGRATREVAHNALQVFGGIAFTAEHPAHRFLRRIVARHDTFGTPREHTQRLGRELARGLHVPA
jgi:alkylation response protein AidB-like acyl-CoA dehydrogenase